MKARRSAEFLAAAHRGDWRRARDLLAAGADPDAQGAHGVTALSMAAGRGHVEVCADLLERRANPNAREKTSGCTPLMRACGVENSAATLRLLLEARADPHLRDEAARTALLIASAAGNVDAAEVLIDFGADVQAVARGDSASAKAMGLEKKVLSTFLYGHNRTVMDDYVAFRRKEGALRCEDSTFENESDVFALVEALHQPVPPEAQSNADLDEEVEAVHQASGPELLLPTAAAATPMETDPSITPEAAFQAPTRSLTIDWGDESAPDSDGESQSDSPEAFLPEGLWLSSVAPLRGIDTAPSPLSAERLSAREPQKRRLRGVDERCAGDGDTPLLAAARAGHRDMCELLLWHGADLDARDSVGDTALMAAARAGHVEALRPLLACAAHAAAGGCAQAGAAREQDRRAALQLAEVCAHEAAARVLRGYTCT
eukprot:TRINITY_DN45749_c0_g1_i1.p1 TRINITY_DN45749_c0_g1~~TRINITY_DN45749_c0_g1_i1.p1  ORF type:complete len:458 (-),score=85.89 TRINITY_DN45749_c0_g1_i1:90-1382(-)